MSYSIGLFTVDITKSVCYQLKDELICRICENRPSLGLSYTLVRYGGSNLKSHFSFLFVLSSRINSVLTLQIPLVLDLPVGSNFQDHVMIDSTALLLDAGTAITWADINSNYQEIKRKLTGRCK